MKQYKYNSKITVENVVFKGVQDIINHAIDKEPKDGLYVAYDCKKYPCFDSDDYASEDRFYWNFVFAETQLELACKLDKIKHMDQLACNYNKLTQDLHPMAYWGGDTYNPVMVTE